MSSPGWTASERRSDLLRFLVAETLAGRGDRLRWVAIAVDVFGRAADFDPQIDAIVRVEARRLRRDLDSYYGGEGRHDLVLITVPKGRYVPHFAWNRAPRVSGAPQRQASGAAPSRCRAGSQAVHMPPYSYAKLSGNFDTPSRV